jgi:GT2 family glycosyltransferase
LKLVLLTLSKNRKGKVNIPGKIFAPHGSCIIFNKNYFERGGTLEPISFLFGEEMFIGETARRINLEVVYVPDLQVSHTEHSSFGNFISRRTNTYYRQSINDMIHYYYPLKPEIKTY